MKQQGLVGEMIKGKGKYMTDNVFRSSTPVSTSSTEAPTNVEAKSSTPGGIVDAEVPYLDYESSHGRPHTADYFELGDTWSDPEGGFPKEVELIEDYVNEKIKSGEIGNSTQAVKILIKNMEKLTRVSDEVRPLVRVETIAAYIDFVRKTQNIKKKLGSSYQ